MPILILIASAIGGAIWWWVRNNPRDAIDIVQDAAVTAKNAPRRMRFKRATNTHPVDGIDDPRVAVGAIAVSFVMLDDFPTKDDLDRLQIILRSKLRCSENDAIEMQSFGKWICTECGTADAAASRLIRRLKTLDGTSSFALLQEVLLATVNRDLSQRQQDVLADFARVMR